MSHPDELLAGWVDQALTSDERAEVAEHLASCTACRREVASAQEAKDLMASLPHIEAPAGFAKRARTDLADDEAPAPAAPRSAAAGRAAQTRQRQVYKWIGGAAAAALVLVLGFSVINRPGGTTDALSESAPAPAAEAATTADAAPGAGNLDVSELQALAERERDAWAEQSGLSVDRPVESPPAGYSPDPSQEKAQDAVAGANTDMLSANPGAATRCLRRSGSLADGGELLTVYEGSLQSVPAYFGVVLEGPTPGSTPDRISIWVVNSSACATIGYAQSYLNYPSPSPLPQELEGIKP